MEIFFTLLSACKYERDTFNGMSGESITPFNIIKNWEQFLLRYRYENSDFGTIGFYLSEFVNPMIIFGKYKIPVKGTDNLHLNEC